MKKEGKSEVRKIEIRNYNTKSKGELSKGVKDEI